MSRPRGERAPAKRLVIANRGEIARRVLRSARERGLTAAVISTSADLGAPVRREADAVLEVPDFLDAGAVVAAASDWEADLLHPGYGFLSENADFAAAVEEAGIAFVGPTPEAMRRLGGKEEARRLAVAAGVPVLPAVSSERIASASDPAGEVERSGVGFPCAVKAAFGGGGIGIRVVREPAALAPALEAAARQAEAAFGDATVYPERWIERPRHVEIQVFGDGQGGGVHLGERECSIQRRRQKLLEWTPAFGVSGALRRRMGEAALRLVAAGRYRGAGTVEFLLDAAGGFFFLEVNTRLQVEHPVTEEAYGVDLVDAQLERALGGWPPSLPPPAASPDRFEPLPRRAAAVEARLLAESPANGFAPSPGQVRRFRVPAGEGVRVDSGVAAGAPVPAGFDSLLAKVIVSGASIGDAARRLAETLRETVAHGVETNASFLAAVLEHPDFLAGRTHTGWVEEHRSELAASRMPERLRESLGSERIAEALAEAASGRRNGPGAEVFRAVAAGDGRPRIRPGNTPGEVVVTAAPGAGEAGPGLPEEVRVVATDLGDGNGTAVTAGGETVVLGADDAVEEVGKTGGAAAPGAPEEIRAPLAGTLVRLPGDPGTPVRRGEVVAVVESMKMHWEIRAERDGILGDPTASPGDPVTGGRILRTILSPDFDGCAR